MEMIAAADGKLHKGMGVLQKIILDRKSVV